MNAEGPVTLVTGCASGIGAALGHALIARGYRVTLCDIDGAGLEAAFDPGEATRLAVFDIREREGWQRVLDETIARWGRLDTLINIAGYLQPSWVDAHAPEEIGKHLEINAMGAMLGTRLAAPIMKRAGSGHIINMASLAGVAPVPGLALYAAAKFAVRGYSLAAAQELRPHGVFVTVVCPDAVQTPMLDLQLDYPEAALTFSGPRVLTTDEVVSAIIDRAMKKRPLEVLIPRSRGLLAKIASFWPPITFLIGDKLRRKGDRVRLSARGRQQSASARTDDPADRS